MKTFKQFIQETATQGKIFNFGATAYGNADIDKTTASEIQRGVLKPEWQYLGNRNNKLIPGYSVANNALPHGTIVRITDRRTNQPVGVPFGNVNGIYKVEDTGGKQVKRNIDFYSGSNKDMFNYYAKYGTNSNVLNVEILNIKPGSSEEQQIIANLNRQQNIPNSTKPQFAQQGITYNSVDDALTGLQSGVDILTKTMGGGIK
jgi:3D (Asp-Asp-Asp) domain-containing protein